MNINNLFHSLEKKLYHSLKKNLILIEKNKCNINSYFCKNKFHLTASVMFLGFFFVQLKSTTLYMLIGFG